MKQYILNGGNPGEARAVLNEARVNELYFLGVVISRRMAYNTD